MKLIDLITAAEARISEGSEALWDCWNGEGRWIDFVDQDNTPYCAAIYNNKSFEVHYISVDVPGYDQAFQWLSPLYKDAYYAEAKRKKQDPELFVDNIFYTNVDSEERILEYVRDVCATYYDNLPIPGEAEPFVMEMPGTLGSAKLVFPDSEPNSAK